MKLVTYLRDGKEYVGLLEGGAVRPLPCPDLNTLIESGDLAEIAVLHRGEGAVRQDQVQNAEER